MILFIGTLSRFSLSRYSSPSSHEAHIKEMQANSIKPTRANNWVHGKSLRHWATGCTVGMLRDVLIESQRTIPGHENQSRSVPLRGTGLLCCRGQLT